MQALVTGGSGFLGSRLVQMLLAAGAEVTLLARAGSTVPLEPRVRLVRAELAGPGAEFTAELRAALSRVTHIFHCAGCSTDWAPPAEYRSANVDLTIAMLRLASEHTPRLERFLHVSTTDVYGYPVHAGDETMPLCATALPYNRTKLLGDRLVQQAMATAALPATILRPASIYGPRGKAFVTDVVTLLRQRMMLLVNGGRARGGFVYVDDVCRALLLAAAAPAAAGEAYNLSSNDGTSWREYTSALARALGLPRPWLHLPFRAALALAAASEVPHHLRLPGRPLLTRHAVYLLGRDQQYATTKARAQLGWSPQVSLEEGIARSLGL